MPQTRRTFIQSTAATVTGLATTTTASATTTWRTIDIISQGGGPVRYKLRVTGTIKPLANATEDYTNPDKGVAAGSVGPKRGTDSFKFTGDIAGFEIAGPATVKLDGSKTNPDSLPRLDTALRACDFHGATTNGKNTIQFKHPQSRAIYEFSVTGQVHAHKDAKEDRAHNGTVSGHLGPDRGVDTFSFTGQITRFRLVGDTDVYLNGQKITPTTCGRQSKQTLKIAGPTTDTRYGYDIHIHGSQLSTAKDSDDCVEHTKNGYRIIGSVGPHDTDTYQFTGELRAITVTGAPTVTLNGAQVCVCDYPNVVEWDLSQFPAFDRKCKLRVAQASDDCMATYEFTTNGQVWSTGDVEESVGTRHAFGWLWPGAGKRDTFRYLGKLTTFKTVGYTTVTVNGQTVTPTNVRD